MAALSADWSNITAGSIISGNYPTGSSITIDANQLYGSGWSTAVTTTYTEPDENEGEESALDWLDRRVEEMRVEL
jgi:hypothetical protein